jgi:hypothetical protein
MAAPPEKPLSPQQRIVEENGPGVNGAASSEPGPVREANGVRAPASQRLPATQNIPPYEW